MSFSLLAAALLATAPSDSLPRAVPRPPAVEQTSTLRAFRNDAELRQFIRGIRPPLPPPPPPPPSPPPPGAAPSVTNVQHAGVDEGGLVKVHGDYLVILRRGRLFTVRIGDDELRPVSMVDAFGPGTEPLDYDTWYDEILVWDDVVVVVGFNEERGGTELGLFRIDADGRLAYRGTYHVRSHDYYSSRNYTSRLVGGKLVIYSPLIWVGAWEDEPESDPDPAGMLPAFRRWGGADSIFRRTAPATRIYRPAGPVRPDDELVLHTVTVCDLDGDALECQATAVFGGEGRTFYSAPGAMYVWATQGRVWNERGDYVGERRSVLYRIPLDGAAPTALRVSGGPVDQFAFLESGDGHLNVVVRADAAGDAMWDSEDSSGEVSLLRVPLASFGDGSRPVPAGRYRSLPTPPGHGFHNRFVGDWLLYGTESSSAGAYAVRWAEAGEPIPLPLAHGVERIEAMGSGAVLIGGAGGDLHFSGVRLGTEAALTHGYVRRGASQGETRSHGFFYRSDGDDSGVLGLPLRGPAGSGYEHLRYGSAGMLFLRNRQFRLQELGELAAREADISDDGCLVSCIDWYGNARPLFLHGRVFALLGYEVVEGREADGRVHEVRRISFAPGAPVAGVAGSWRYEETMGSPGEVYHCRSGGTYHFRQDSTALGVRYEQRGECTMAGVATRSDGEGTGTGRVSAISVEFTAGPCTLVGSLTSPNLIVGTMRCLVRYPDGEGPAYGRWEARRTAGAP